MQSSSRLALAVSLGDDRRGEHYLMVLVVEGRPKIDEHVSCVRMYSGRDSGAEEGARARSVCGRAWRTAEEQPYEHVYGDERDGRLYDHRAVVEAKLHRREHAVVEYEDEHKVIPIVLEPAARREHTMVLPQVLCDLTVLRARAHGGQRHGARRHET